MRMNGIPGMSGVKVVTGAAAAVLLMALSGPTPALADTIEAALVRAYQNNPQLNAQRAPVRSTDENVPQALSGYRPKVARHRERRLSIHRHQLDSGGIADRDRANRNSRHRSAAQRRRSRSTQTLFNGNQTANKTRAAESQVSGAREGSARARADRAAVGGHDLHGLSARRRHRRGSAQQHPRARADAEADPRPLQCRRGDAHRRRAVGSAACRRQDPATDRRIQPDHDAIELPPHHRQRAASSWRRARRSIASCRERCPARSISA